MRKFFIAAVVAVASLLASASSADAAFRLRVEDTTSAVGVVVTDNGTGDGWGVAKPNSGLGKIVFTDTVGLFDLSVTTGVKTPEAAMPGFYDGIHLSNISVNSTGAGVLRLILEADGFNNAPDGQVTLVNSSSVTLNAAAGSFITFDSYADTSNAIPALGSDVDPAAALPAVTGIGGVNSVSTSLTFTPPPTSQSGESVTSFTKSGAYSLYTVVTVTFTGAGNVSFDNITATTPAPAGLVLALTGMPVLGLGTWLRRRRIATAA